MKEKRLLKKTVILYQMLVKVTHIITKHIKGPNDK